jgi:site-specific DNA-methyltransferase (adenine-specific)
VAAVNNTVMFSRQSDEWETPQALFDALDAEFRFMLDAAASAANAKCREFFGSGGEWDTPDGLLVDWRQWTGFPIWLNPPYSKCAQFVAKAADEAAKGCTVVMLLPARTCTRWFHAHIWNADTHQPRPGVEVRFLKGRLKFGSSQNSAPFPSMVVVFRPKQASVLSEEGA